MKVEVGDILYMKKSHPCGSFEWSVIRTGIDFGIKCKGCGHFVVVDRRKIEKSIKNIIKPDK